MGYQGLMDQPDGQNRTTNPFDSIPVRKK